MDAAQIIKDLQVRYKKNSPFKQNEQSDEAFAIIVRHCREKGNYAKIIADKKTYEDSITETKELFQQSEDEYSKFLSDWNEVKNASEKAKVLAKLGNKTEYALAAFNKSLHELQVKKQALSTARKEYFEKCTTKINTQKEIVKVQDVLLKEIDTCIEQVRVGLGVADYGIDSLQKTERFFELGISRKLKGEKSSFNTLGCTLFFSQNRAGVWHYDDFSTIINESLLDQTKLSISSALQNKETGSFLLAIKGELNLNVLDINKRKESKTFIHDEKQVSTGSVVTTDKGIVNIQKQENLDHNHQVRTGEINVEVKNANQSMDGKHDYTRELSDKVLTVEQWNQKVTQEVTEYYIKVQNVETTINTIRSFQKTFDKLKPEEKKSTLDQITSLWDDVAPYTKYVKKLPYIGPVIRVIDKAIPIIKGAKKVLDIGKSLWNDIFGDNEPTFKLTDREVTEIKETISTQINTNLTEQGFKKTNSTTNNTGNKTVDSKRDLNENIETTYEDKANQNEIKVGAKEGFYDENTKDQTTGSVITTDNRITVQTQQNLNTIDKSSNELHKDFNSDEDITITDQFNLVLICETAADGQLIVRKDSSSDLGPIEKGIKPKLKHDNDLEISFSLMTKQLYN